MNIVLKDWAELVKYLNSDEEEVVEILFPIEKDDNSSKLLFSLIDKQRKIARRISKSIIFHSYIDFNSINNK